MNTDHLKYLLTVAQCQSINQAAEQLHLQHQYLSKVVSGIEQTLGIAIFKRDRKGITITPTGEWALERIKQIIALTDELEAGPQEQQQKIFPEYHNDIKLYASAREQIVLLTGLNAFRSQFPNVSVTIIDKHIHLIPKELLKNPMAMALYNRVLGTPEQEIALPEELCWIPLNEKPLVALACNNNHIANKYQSISLSTLAKQEIVIFGTDDADGSFLSSILGPEATNQIKYTVANYELFYKLLQTYPYFSLGPSSKDRNGELREIPLKEKIKLQQGLLFHRSALDSFVTKRLINMYLEQFGQAAIK